MARILDHPIIALLKKYFSFWLYCRRNPANQNVMTPAKMTKNDDNFFKELYFGFGTK